MENEYEQNCLDDDYVCEGTPQCTPPDLANYDEEEWVDNEYNDDNQEYAYPSYDDENPTSVVDNTQLQSQIDFETLKCKCEDLISGKDAIMEPRISETIDKLLHTFDWSPELVVQKLVQGYTGYAQMCNIVAGWLCSTTDVAALPVTAESINFTNSGTVIQSPSIQKQGNISKEEGIVMNTLASFIKQKFDTSAADSLLDLGSEVPTWLLEMIQQPPLRRLLVELFDANRGSVLLGYCLRKISSMGFHRDIAEVVGEADYFQVFNALLTDILQRMMFASEEEVASLTKDMKRMSSSGEYMMLYALSMLNAIEDKTNSMASSGVMDTTRMIDSEVNKSSISTNGNSCKRKRLEEGEETEVCLSGNEPTESIETATQQHVVWQRCCGKLRRLRHELELSQIWEKGGVMDGAARFALRLTRVSGVVGESGGETLRRDVLEVLLGKGTDVTVLRRLIRHLLPSWMSDSIGLVDPQVLGAGISDIDIQGILSAPLLLFQERQEYLRHPQLLEILTDALMHPTKAIPNNHPHPAVLLGLAAWYPRNNTMNTDLSLEISSIEALAKDLSAIISALIRVKSLCYEVSKLGYGVQASVSEQPEAIISLMDKPVVSICVLRWVLACVRDRDFISRPSYVPMLPTLLQFIVVACDRYPLQHPDCFRILKVILQQSPEAVERGDSGLVVSARKDALDTFLHLMGRGFVLPALDFLKSMVTSLDATLVRHVVVGILRASGPPYSPEYIAQVSGLLTCKSVREAVSRHFADGSNLLLRFISHVLSNSNKYSLPAIQVSELSLLKPILS